MFRERKKLILGLCLIRQSKQTSTIGFRVSIIKFLIADLQTHRRWFI